MSVIDEVTAERMRQRVVLGYTNDHDDTHVEGELTFAAMAYAHHAVGEVTIANTYYPWVPDEGDIMWPEKRTSLIRAAALIVAEIERLDRKNKKVMNQE